MSKNEWQEMMDRYGCYSVDEMIECPAFIQAFVEWANKMDAAAERSDNDFDLDF